jgi:hypothetical protein
LKPFEAMAVQMVGNVGCANHPFAAEWQKDGQIEQSTSRVQAE